MFFFIKHGHLETVLRMSKEHIVGYPRWFVAFVGVVRGGLWRVECNTEKTKDPPTRCYPRPIASDCNI